MSIALFVLLALRQEAIGVGNAAQVKEQAAFEGSKEAVFSVAFSPDGKRLASAGIDHMVRLWDPKTGAAGAVLKGHAKQAIVVAFSADGATVESAGYDRTLRLWDAATGRPGEVQSKNPKDELQIVDLETVCNAFSPDGSTLAFGSGGGFVYLWNVKEKTRREISLNNVTSVHGYLGFSGDGTRFATAWHEGDVDKPSEVRVFDWHAGAAGKEIALVKAPAGAFYGYEAVALDRNGSTLAAVDSKTTEIHLWDVKAGTLLRKLKGHKHDESGAVVLLGLAFSPDGTVLASAAYDRTVRLWDVKEGKELACLPAAHPAFVTFSPDGTMLAACGTEGKIHVWAVKK